MRHPMFIEWIKGSVWSVGCPCGHVEPLCLAQGATAIVCLACRQELALPTLDIADEPPGWFPGEDSGCPSIVKDDDSGRFDTDADACIHALALLLKGDTYTAETYDFAEVAEAIKGSIDMAVARRVKRESCSE